MPLPAGDAATAVGVGLGLVLLRTAASLRRRRRRAWQIAFLAAALICGSYILSAHRGANGWMPVLAVRRR
jgi:lysyl-tRNA synthetase class 2